MAIEPERLGPYDIISADATLTLKPDESGIVPVRDQDGNVIGEVRNATIDKATASVMADIYLYDGLRNGQSLSFEWTVSMPLGMP